MEIKISPNALQKKSTGNTEIWNRIEIIARKSSFAKTILNQITEQSLLVRVFAAFLSVTLAATLRIWPLQELDNKLVWLTFYPAIMITSLFGGFFIGVFSVILTCLVALFLWPILASKPFINDFSDWLGLAVFVLNGTMMSGVADAMRRANIRAKNAQKELEACNRELEAFSYSVSHDLRAPLRGINGWSLALKEDSGYLLDNKSQEYLNRVLGETERMGILIDDLLKLSQITRSNMKWQSVNLSEIAERVKKRMLEENSLRKISFTVYPNMVTQGGHNFLEIVLTQLFHNACKFTSKIQEAKIEFGKINVEVKDIYFVRDNGAGINMEFAKNLFGAFQRMHKQSEFPGSGIGLAIVKRIIDLHHGKIWVESAENCGAIFYFSLKERTI